MNEPITDAQIGLMNKMKIDWNENMTKQEASQAIQEVMGNKPQFRPKPQFTPKPNFSPATSLKSYSDTNFYVSYTKDLIIAIINAEVELVKLGKRESVEDITEITKQAVGVIGYAKEEFK